MTNFRIGVKAFIIENGSLLFVKRRANDPHNPGMWDLPGGRVELGEDPRAGLQREVKEETNLDVKLVLPLHVTHFTRQDGQIITLIFFLCRKLSNQIELSVEHQDFKWVDIKNLDDEIPYWLEPVIENYLKIKV